MEELPKLTKAYYKLFKELSNRDKYCVRTVYEHYVKYGGKPDSKRCTVVLRIDVDRGFHLAYPLALWIKKFGLTASHYFLTHPERYYKIWDSDIPRKIRELGQEVGLHYDHYYEQLVFGKNGLEELKKDIKRLSELVGDPIKGAVYHGHPDIDRLGKTNWELLKEVEPAEVGLEYHDGLKSVYIAPGVNYWFPKCDHRLSDFMGFPNSWGWNYLPFYPVMMLKLWSKPGKVIHIAFHTKNAFSYWKYWTSDYGEVLKKEFFLTFWKKRIIIFYRYIIRPCWVKPIKLFLKLLGIEQRVKRWLKRS